jgi:hypothetical protein
MWDETFDEDWDSARDERDDFEVYNQNEADDYRNEDSDAMSEADEYDDNKAIQEFARDAVRESFAV